MNERPTPDLDAEAFPVMTWPKGDNPMVVRVEVARELKRQRDELLAALLGVLEEWEGGYRPEDCGTTMAIAREVIAAVKGEKPLREAVAERVAIWKAADERNQSK